MGPGGRPAVYGRSQRKNIPRTRAPLVPRALDTRRRTFKRPVGQPRTGDSPGQAGQGKIPRQGPLALERLYFIGAQAGSFGGRDFPLDRRIGRRLFYTGVEEPGPGVERLEQSKGIIQGQGFLSLTRATPARASARRKPGRGIGPAGA